MSIGPLYRYFPTKEALAHTVVLRREECLSGVVEDALVGEATRLIVGYFR